MLPHKLTFYHSIGLRFLIKTQAHFSIPLLCVKTCVAQASRVFFVRGFGCALFVFVRGFGFSSDELLKNISFKCF